LLWPSAGLIDGRQALAAAAEEAGIPNIEELQQAVDEANAAYDDATQRIADLEAEIAATGTRIDILQARLPEVQASSNEAAADYYRMVTTSNVVLEAIFTSKTFSESLDRLDYAFRTSQSYLDTIKQMQNLNTELELSRTSLEESKALVLAEQAAAEVALQRAISARDAAEAAAFQMSEETAAATSADAASAAEGQAHEAPLPVDFSPEAAATEELGQLDADPAGVVATADGSGSDGGVQLSEKQAFVNEWALRIDAYLAGSPLAGYGYAFANAAYDYNVDPRWSPAISCLESSMGRYCFRAYNAWGWGQVDWPDWETAIYAHVRGLSEGYGYSITVAAAQKYCPPNCDYWYSFVSSQMESI